ncbi:MAG: universal stress protein [Noviherbaspirillum sp.]
MTYKTILVQMEDTDLAERRAAIAADIASTENAHLVGAAWTGAATGETPQHQAWHGDMASETAIRGEADGPARPPAQAALDRFDRVAQRLGCHAFERRLVEGDPATSFSLQGRYCDLLLLGQCGQGSQAADLHIDFIQYVVLNCARPVLVVPADTVMTDNPFGSGEALIGWNASVSASRAVRDALPLLARARKTYVAVLNAVPEVYGEEPGADIAIYLARHGIAVEIIRQTVGTDAGHGLLALAGQMACGLLVMGCIAHHHSGSWLPGGATRVALQSSRIPVLMAH